MTLSPAAQAVNTAVLAIYPYGVAQDMALSSDLAVTAAALRALADHQTPAWNGTDPACHWTPTQHTRHELRNIATELEAAARD
jgi:hypothetical protein